MKKHGNDRAFCHSYGFHCATVLSWLSLSNTGEQDRKMKKPLVFNVLPIKKTQQILIIGKNGPHEQSRSSITVSIAPTRCFIEK
jgi:hypothetical protein